MMSGKSLVAAFTVGRSTVTPLVSEKDLLSYKSQNSEYSEWIKEIDRRGFQCLKKHEARVFLIETPKNKCIVWLSWLGKRGSRWHLVKYFLVDDSKYTSTVKKMLEILLIRYQDEWANHLMMQTK